MVFSVSNVCEDDRSNIVVRGGGGLDHEVWHQPGSQNGRFFTSMCSGLPNVGNISTVTQVKLTSIWEIGIKGEKARGTLKR